MLTKRSLALVLTLSSLACGGSTTEPPPFPPAVTIAIAPASINLLAGGQAQLSATVGGTTNTGVSWSVTEPGGGTITAQGLYTAPATAGSYHVVATSQADASKSATATVTVSVPPVVAVTVDPVAANLLAGATQQFSATVTGSATTAVTWLVQESGGGTVSNAGLYTAPGAAGTYHVVATSQADTSKSATATVTVSVPPVVAVTVDPAAASMLAGATQQFGATVTGSATTTVTWSVQESGGGTVSNAGLYTAPGVAGTYHVVATSQADTSKSATVIVTVALPPVVAITVSPTSASLLTGGTQQFSAVVTGNTNTAVTWSVQESGGGAVSHAGIYTAPGAAGTYHVVATSVADTSKSATVTVTVALPPVVVVTVSPTSASLLTGGTQQFSAVVTGNANTAVTWAVQESGGGAVSLAGLYTAPGTAGTYHVVAASAADTNKSATATVTVALPPVVAVAISPTSASLLTGGTQQFSATVTGNANTAVTWSVRESSAGAISTQGLYAAPATAGTYHVVATSQADTSKSATALVLVAAPGVVAVAINPGTASISTGGTQQFSATVAGSADTAVAWSVLESAGGAVTSNGLYVGPAVAGTYHVVATSHADASKSATATVSVVPAPPTAVMLELSQGYPVVSWSAPAGAASGLLYQVLRSTDGVAFANYGALFSAPPASPLPDPNVVVGGTYYYQVESVQGGQASTAIATTPPSVTVIGAVTSLTATAAGCRAVHLAWQPVAGATGYLVVRQLSGVETDLALNLAATQYDDVGGALANGTTYGYFVFARNAGGYGTYAQASVVTLAGATDLFVTAGDIQTSMSWSAPVGAGASTTYSILRAGSQAGALTPVKQGYAATSWTDTGVTPATAYWYAVQATTGGVTGCASVAIDGTTGAAGSAITGRNARRLSVLDNGPDVAVTEDLSIYGWPAMHYTPGAAGAAGVFTYYQGQGTADGYYTIPNVPPGFNYVYGWYLDYTDTRQFDLLAVGGGRSDLTYATTSTPVAVTVNGLAPWNAALDDVEMYSQSGGLDYYVDLYASTGTPAAGATSAAMTADFNGVGLLDTGKGDVVTINDLANVAGAAPFPYATPQRTCTAALNPAAMADGTPQAIGCANGADLVPVAQNISTMLNLARSQFKAVVNQAGPGALSTAGQFFIGAEKGLSTYGMPGGYGILPTFLFPAALKMYLDSATTDVTEPMTYGAPFGAGYQLAYQYYAGVSVTYTAPATSACPSPTPLVLDITGYQQYDVLTGGQLPSSITPAINPVSDVTISPLGTGGPVQVGWTEPTAGAHVPTTYAVAVYQLGLDANCKTTATWRDEVTTVHGQASVVFRPTDFSTQDGSGTYYLRVLTEWFPGELPDLQQPALVSFSARNAIVSTRTPVFRH